MKLNSTTHKALLVQAVLASTLFGAYQKHALAVLTPVPATTTTAITPDTGGGAGGLGGYNITANAVTLTVTSGYIVGQTPSPNGISIDVNNASTPLVNDNVIFQGNGTAQGTVGTTNPLSMITLQGGAGTIVNFQGPIVKTSVGLVFANTTTPTSQATLVDGTVLTGTVNSNTAGGSGLLTFLGGGQVTGNIGLTNQISTLSLNSTSGVAKTDELDGSTVKVGNINVQGTGGTTLLLNNQVAGMTLTTTGNITTNNNNIDTITLANNGNSTITAQIGAAGNTFLALQVGQKGNATISGDIYATTTLFQGNNTLTLSKNPTATIFGAVNSSAAGQGTLTFQNSGDITGNVGDANNSLAALNVNTAGNANAQLELDGALIKANTITVDDDGTGLTKNGSILLLNNANMVLTGNIAAETTGEDTVNIQNANTINGNIGAPAIAFYQVLVGQNGPTTINGNVYTTSAQGTQFQGDNVLTLGPNDNITGNVSTTAANTGTLQVAGGNTISGTVGNGAAIKNINTSGAAAATFQGAVNTNTITTSTNNVGSIIFQGGATITGTTGAVNQALNNISVQGPGAGRNVTFGGSVQDGSLNFINATGTTAQFNNGGTLNTIDSNTLNAGTVLLNAGTTTVNSTVGATNAINAINVAGAGAAVVLNGNSNVNALMGVSFTGAANNLSSITVGNNATINSTVNNDVGANVGILQFTGAGGVTGAVGGAPGVAPINTLNLLGPGTVSFGSTTDVNNLNFTTNANTSSTANFANTATVNGNITNTTGTPAGNLVFQTTGMVAGTTGVAGSPINNVTLEGAGPVTFAGNVQTASVNFAGPATNTSKINFTGGVTTNSIDNTTGASGMGYVVIGATSTVNGPIGAANSLNEIDVNSANTTLTLNGDSAVNNVNFTGAANNTSNLTLGPNAATFTGNIGNTTGGVAGNVLFQGTTAATGTIGTAAAPVNLITVNGTAGTTVTLDSNATPNYVFAATNTNVNNGGTLAIPTSLTDTGNLTLTNNSAIGLNTNNETLTVTGTYTQNPGILAINMQNQVAAGQIKANLANVLAGSVAISNPPTTAPTGTTILPLVTGGAGSVITQLPVTGVNNSLLLQFSTKADNVNHQLDLVINSVPASNFATQSNTTGIGNALDSIINNGDQVTGNLQRIILALEAINNVDELDASLASLAPIVDGAVPYESFNTQELTFDAITDRYSETYYSVANALQAKRRQGYQGYAAGDALSNTRGAWAKILGINSRQSLRDDIPGYRGKIWGLEGGTDAVVSENAIVGVAGSWAKLNLHQNISSSKTSADNFQATLYGHYYFDVPLYVHAFAGVGYNHYIGNRNVFFSNVYLTPQAHYHGWQSGAKAEIGYVFGQGDSLHTVPFATLFYSHLALHGYTETNAGTANQNVKSSHYNLLKGGAGIKMAYDYAMNKPPVSVLQPEVHAQVFYDFVQDRFNTTSDFIGGGPVFFTQGARPARGGLNAGASVTAYSDLNMVLSAHYEYELKEEYYANSGFIRLRYEW